MVEQKFLSRLSLLIAIATLLIAVFVEFLPSEYITIGCLKGHRNFGVTLFLGVSSGAIISFFTTRMLFCIEKAKVVNLLINKLISIKRCIYDTENNNSSVSLNAEEIRGVCNEILGNPENWSLEQEITLEKDFIAAIKDIRKICMTHDLLMDKKYMIGEYIDRFVLSILKQCHVQSNEIKTLLEYYDIKPKTSK